MQRFLSGIALLGLIAFGTSVSAELDEGTIDPDPQEMARKFPDWKKACEAKDGFACGNLGALFALGKGMPKDDEKAFDYYAKACEYGQALRCLRAGTLVLNGKGLAASAEKAADFFAKGCKLFNVDSCVFYYAVTHGKKIGLEGELTTLPGSLGAPKADPSVLQSVATTLTLACNKAVERACGNLGALYEEGNAVAKDLSKALSLFERACDLGDAERCARAGRFYANGVGGLADRQKAGKLFDRSCELKKSLSCSLAFRARSGLSIDLKITESPRQASVVEPKDLVKKQLSLYPFAMTSPLEEIPSENFPTELKEKVMACNRGDSRACGNAAAAFLDEQGKPREQAELIRLLLEKSCYLGRAQRCVDLAKLHANGWGVEKSQAREKAALAKACELGDQASCGNKKK